MILEQAFQLLPEVLCGSRYPGQQYESGLVSAFAMATLQELNGRNAANPLSCFEGECVYAKDGFGAKRWLRADLLVNTQPLKVANDTLGDHYGWRHHNWLECKFMRSRSNDTIGTKTAITAAIATDLVRLATLVPEPSDLSHAARYLLHVYDRPPIEYLAHRRNKTKNGKAGVRPWTKAIVEPGSHELTLSDFDLESDTFQSVTGDLRNLEVNCSITNFAIEPSQNVPHQHKLYWCYLTRLDVVTVKQSQNQFSIGRDRSVTESSPGARARMRDDIASRIGILAEGEDQPPERAPQPPMVDEPSQSS